MAIIITSERIFNLVINSIETNGMPTDNMA